MDDNTYDVVVTVAGPVGRTSPARWCGVGRPPPPFGMECDGDLTAMELDR